MLYSVVRQEGGITQTLVSTKARLAKRDLTVTGLELVSTHMATNLVVNVRNALKVGLYLKKAHFLYSM